MKVVLVMFKDGERRDFPVTLEKTTMGRRPDSHLRVQTNDVSRQHCELVLTKAGLSVRDLGSSNGTFVNGKRIAESPLKAGDRLALGPVVFLVQVDGNPAKVTPFDLKPPAGISTPDTRPASGEEATKMQPPAGKAASPPAAKAAAPSKAASPAPAKAAAPDKKKDDEEVLDLDDFDIDSMFADDDEDDDLGPPKNKKK